MPYTDGNERDVRVALGQIRGSSFVTMVGKRFNLPSFFEVTIWDGPTDDYFFTDPSTDRITHISSSSTLDVSKNIFIPGLDENWNEVNQIVTLNGQNKVALTTELIRIQPGCQAFQNLDGDVYVYEDGTITGGIPDDLTSVRAYIEGGINVSKAMVYTVPKGKIAFPKSLDLGAAPSATCCVRFINIAYFFSGVRQEGYVSPIVDEGTTFINLSPKGIFPFPEKTDFEMRAYATTPNAAVSPIAVFEQVQINFNYVGGGVFNV